MEIVQVIEKYKWYLGYVRNKSQRRQIFYSLWIERFFVFLESEKINDNIQFSNIEDFIHSLNKNPKFQRWHIFESAKALSLFVAMVKDRALIKELEQVEFPRWFE